MKKFSLFTIFVVSVFIGCGSGNSSGVEVVSSNNTLNGGNFISSSSVDNYKPDVGRLLASQCFGCHGTNGISKTSWDSIAREDELYEEMFESGGIMEVHAKAYTPQEISLMESFLSSVDKSNSNSSSEYNEDEDEYEEESEYSSRDYDDRDDDDDDDEDDD